MRPLLHIGYHKTGTTWLQRHVFPKGKAGFFLVAGPDALRPSLVQVDAFDFGPELVREAFQPGIKKAQARNLVPVFSHERLSGNPHSGGYDSKQIADRLAATFPEARILVVIREQRNMLLSIYKQYVRMGGAASFRQYVTLPTGVGRVPVFRFEFLEYHRLVGHYRGLFGAEDVLVLPYELLAKDPASFLGRIGEFLGAPVAVPTVRWVNISPSAFALSLKRHANRWVVRDALNPAPPFAFEGSNETLLRTCRTVDRIAPAALKEGHERRWQRFAEQEIGERYAESNAITAELTGIDLRAFGYACKR